MPAILHAKIVMDLLTITVRAVIQGVSIKILNVSCLVLGSSMEKLRLTLVRHVMLIA